MDDKKNPWADFNNQIKKEREKENEFIKQKFSKEKLFKMAQNFTQQQDYQKALDYFKLVTEKDPKHFLAWVNTGIIYTYHNLLGTLKGRRTAYYKRHYDEGIECFKKALELKPNDINCLLGLGDAYQGKKDYVKSIEFFEKVSKIDSKNSKSWNGIGFTYLEMNEFEKAIPFFEKTIKYTTNNVGSLIGLGFCYFVKKDFDKAIESLREAMKYQKLQEKPKKDIFGRDIYSFKLDTIAQLLTLIDYEKENFAFLSDIEEEFDIKFEGTPSFIAFFKKTPQELDQKSSIIEKEGKLMEVDTGAIETNRTSVLEKKLLKSDNDRERLDSALLLNKIQSKEADLALLKAFQDKSDRVRELVIEKIEGSKNLEKATIIPYLLKLIEDENAKIREKAVRILGNIGNGKIIPYLLKKLIDPYHFVRGYAAEALGKIRDIIAAKYLIQCLKTEITSFVKTNIIWALGNIGDNSHLNILIDFLRDEKEVLEVRSEAALALAKIGGEKAFETLLNTLNSVDWNKYSGQSKSFKKFLIMALANFKDNQLTEIYIRLLKDELQNQKYQIDSEVITTIIKSLGIIGDKKAIEILLKTLDDTDEKFRVESAKALIKLNDKDVNRRIFSILFDNAEKTPFKRIIINSLNELKKDEIVLFLNELKKFGDKEKITIDEQIKNNQKIIIFKETKSRKQIGKISYELSEEDIKKIEERRKETEERRKEAEKEENEKDLEEGVKYLENKIKDQDLMKYIQSLSNISEISNIMQNRNKVISEIYSFYNKHKQNESVKKRISNLIIQFFSPYLEINPFKVEVQYFAMSYNSMRKSELNQLQRLIQDNTDLEEFFKKLESIDINAMIDEELKRISEEVNKINYDVPIENMFNFLLDFSQIIPSSTKTNDSTDNEYKLKTGWGPFHFKILEKEPNKKITYMYNFLSSFGEKGTFYIELFEPSPGKVLVKTRNNIQEISIKAGEDMQITNFLGQFLKTYLDLVIGKIVAKVVQTTFYEKSFDDLTMGNYRILQAKFNALGKDINELKARYFEVKSPLTLNSFECSECGATLKITSKDDRFIICEHCSTPFLMEWQKG